jgi:hypothetical protein
VLAATPGLPFTEDFSDQTLMDSSQTTANWSTEEKAVALAWHSQRLPQLPDGTQAGIAFGGNDDATRAIVLGDVDHDGDLDVLAGNDGQTNKLYLNDGSGGFAAGMTIGSDSDKDDTYALVLGDVDGDGDLDVLTANRNKAQFNKLYLNDGVDVNGTFLGFSSNGIPFGNITEDTRALALGDVDGDGDLDLLVGNYYSTNMLYLNDGSGIFTYTADVDTEGDFFTGNATTALAFGDVDGDGDLDLLAGNDGPHTDKLYRNNGQGKFDDGVSISIGGIEELTAALALGDIDGDGDLDLITVNRGYGPNMLYLNDGNGGFDTVIELGNKTDKTQGLALGDIDGDGDLDLLVGNHRPNQSNKLYINNGVASDGTFMGFRTEGLTIGSDQSYTHAITLGDINGDGNLDVVIGDAVQTNKLYLNNANGSFSATGEAIGSESDIATALTLGDIDGDGDLDVLAGNSRATNKLYLNNGNGSFSEKGLDIGSETDRTNALTLGDIDGDGDLDVLTGNDDATNKLYLNDGSGRFSPTGLAIGREEDLTRALTLGDIDGDGDLDVLAGNVGLNKLYLNDGSGGFSASEDIGIDTDNTNVLLLGDIDGDGDLDLLAVNSQSNKLYLNTGNGSFNPTGEAFGSEQKATRALMLGDIDGDGDLDVLEGNLGLNMLYLNDGSGGFVEGMTIGSELEETRALLLGDIDGDGDLDVLAGNFDETNKLYLNDGSGSFSASEDIGIDTDNTNVLALGDIDGDGDLDLLAGNVGLSGGATNKLYLNNRSGGFSATAVAVGIEKGSTYAIALGDIDGDGDLDLLSGNFNATNKLYLNNGSNGFSAGVDIGSEKGPTYALVLGDIDGDGDLDVLVGNTGLNLLYLNNGSGGFSPTGLAIGIDTDRTQGLVLGDIDGDGDLDLLAGNFNATNKLYLNNGVDAEGTFGGFGPTGLAIGSGEDDTYALAVGDIDGDGDLDLLAGNLGATNKLYLNDGNGSFSATGEAIGSEKGRTTTLVLGDIDGDGDLDVLAGNFGETNKLYLNDGSGSFRASEDIGSEREKAMVLILGDIDSDGDLDILAGNDGQSNKLYLNNGNGGFSATGMVIGSDAERTHALALGDIDADGDLDLLVGDRFATHTLYRQVGFMTHAGQVVSNKINDTETDLWSIRLDATQTSNGPTTRHTSIDYYLSNNGGSQWHQVTPGATFTFPDTGTADLRWKAQLKSLSPSRTPLLSQVVLTLLPDIISPLKASAFLTVDFTYPIQTNNAATSFVATGLPSGLELDPTSGIISGRATSTGIFNVELSATNDSTTATATLVLFVEATEATISNTADSGSESLRAIIAAIAAGETITFYPSLSGEIFKLSEGPLTIEKNLTIDASNLRGGIILSGERLSRVLNIASGVEVVLKGITITKGLGGNGGGISNEGDLTLVDSSVIDNHSSAYGGGIINFGGTTLLRNSTVANNVAGFGGGGIYNGNNAVSTVILENTTVFGNVSTNNGGGIQNFLGSVSINHSTIAGNIAGAGGGIQNGGGALTISNSIIAQNTKVDETSSDIHSNTVIVVAGQNLIGTNETVADELPADGVLVGTTLEPVDPLLAPLANYGGQTQTMLPLIGSPALERALILDNTPSSDQRGYARPTGLLPDIGAVEREEDDDFEVNDDFDSATEISGGSGKSAKIVVGNDDYFKWTSTGFTQGKVKLSFEHDKGNLAIEVYNNEHELIASSDSQNDNELVLIADVDAGQTFFIRIYGVERAAADYEIYMGIGPNDRDHDGIPDESDLDDDGDGYTDEDEAAAESDPLDPASLPLDTDGDFISNVTDTDDDNDGISDADDAFSLIAIGDYVDTDNDGAPDECDAACISLGMAADTDDDNDGVLDVDDAFPLDPTQSKNSTQQKVKNDVDGDGKSDLLWRSNAKGWNFLWSMDGVKTKQAKPINVVQDEGWLMAGQGDYDADGHSDILWRNTLTGMNFIYLMDGLTIKTRKVLNFVDAPQWELRGSGDFNGDGKGDVLWRDVVRGRTHFFLMDGLSIGTNQPSLLVTDLNYKIVVIGDINGDGTDDVIWRNQLTGVNYIWIMANGQIASRYVLNTINGDWTIAGAGDLDGDGTDDIILRNQVDGRNWAYLMESGQIKTSELINTVGMGWQIADMGDYDGDGKADLLWRNESTARNIVHLMDGLTIKDKGVLRPTDNTWQLAQ